MPVVAIKLNIVVADPVLAAVTTEITRALGASLDRSCASVMVSHSHGPLYIDGSPAPAAWIEVRSVIDLGIQAKRLLCQRIADSLANHCAIEPGRVFLQLSRIGPEDAWNLAPSGARCVLDRMGEDAEAVDPSGAMTTLPVA